jgi:hypothetical protein
MSLVYFITHPDVVIDPEVPVPQWPLSHRGKERMKKLLAKPWIDTIGSIYSSTEQLDIYHTTSTQPQQASSLPIQTGGYLDGKQRMMPSNIL